MYVFIFFAEIKPPVRVECYSCTYYADQGSLREACLNKPAEYTHDTNTVRCANDMGCYTGVIWLKGVVY